MTDTEGLEQAWREAEAALPEGWAIRSLIRTVVREVVWWDVVAAAPNNRRINVGKGNTPTAAIRDLFPPVSR
jgi:hypothetical protein